MEQKIDELLKQLHKFLFADSEQVVNEMRIYLLDDSLKEADLAFISSKIFNSKLSLLEFLRQNALQQDKLLSSVKKKVYELLIDYLKLRSQEVSPYLSQIKETCLLSFRSDTNSLVKESSLQLLIKIIEIFNSREIEELIKPKETMVMLLDEIKLRKPSASVKGTIWTLVGLLHDKYGLEDFRVESQDVMFIQLQEQMKSDKPEIKAIIGILKGFLYTFNGDCTLDDDQVEALYTCLKVAIQPIADMIHKGVIKAAMKVLGTHIRVFKQQITAHSIELVTITLQLCVNENMETRDTANEMLGQLIQQISDGLTKDQSIHRDIFRNIMLKIQDILDDPSHTNILLISTIKAVGIFSKAIKTFMGDDHLYLYLEKLIQVSDNKIIKEFEQQEDPKNDFKNFKQILKKQKQLISFIESYSYILQNLEKEPQEAFLLHFQKVCEIGVRHHRKLYQKYRERFYEALASFTKALAFHKAPFSMWIRKFIRGSLIETLKIPDAVIFGGESPYESLQDAVQFWRQWLNKDQIWSEFTCQMVYDELITTITEKIEDLNLTYKVEKGRQSNKILQENVQNQQNQNRILNEEYQGLNDDYVVQYIANDNTDQQFLVRLSNFAEMFLIECKDQWFLRWIPTFSGMIIKKAQQTPRISKMYSLLKTAMQICSKHKYFDTESEQHEEGSLKGEKLNTYNMLLTFFKELIGKQEEYQDELLTSCLDLLLHVPVQILYRKDRRTDNVYLWKGIMFKALDIGRTNNQLAMNSILMLEHWFNLLPMNVTVELYEDILPKLSDFLQVDDDKKPRKKDQQQQSETFQYLEMLKTGNEVNIERKDIALKVLDLLGKIGGHAHSIINNDQNKLIEKENFIKWDPEKRLKFTIPLYTKKVDIYFDAVLPKLVDLAQNSTDRETRVAACEFLHALVIYMIGKNATQPKVGGRHAKQADQEIAPFAKIYKKLFPVIIKLATEVENISRQLFEPLIFQIVRWFSSSRVYEHPEVESLLDALIEGASSRNNSALREMCSNAVAEFAKWSLKQMTDKDIKDNPNSIKSLIRRIESNSNHPDPFKRLSSVLCFQKIFSIIREFDPLVDRFCLEIAHYVLASLKMCHNSLEFSQEVIDNCSQMLKKISKVCQKKMHILMQPNSKRSIHPSIFTFILYLFEKFVTVETVCRREAMKLWEALVKSLPPKNNENMPDNLQKWVFDYYMNKRGEKAIFTRLARIRFEEQKQGDDNKQSQGNEEGNKNHKAQARKTQLSERQKTLDQLTAQIECFTFLMNIQVLTFDDLSKRLIDLKLWMGNLNSFIQDIIVSKFKKNHSKSLDKLLICKEDKEVVTKTRIILITQFFKYLLALDNKSLLWHLQQFEDNDSGFEVPQFCMQIMLIPAIHQLQVLVEDQELERQLRHQCELVLKRLLDITNLDLFKLLTEFIVPKIPLVNLQRIKPSNVDDYHPKMLTSLCLGYLKLGNLDRNIMDYLHKQKSLVSVIEMWLQNESPIHNESSRVLVKFLSKLEIPNEILCEWLTFKTDIYQKTGDILLTYISDNWNHKELQLGNYLTLKVKTEPKLYAVLIPILEKLNKKCPNYYHALFQNIPNNWEARENKDFEDFEIAPNQIKIYAFIVTNCRSQLLDRGNKPGQMFLDHLCNIIQKYLTQMYPVHLKKEVLNLVGLIYNMQTQKGQISKLLEYSLQSLQQHFFPIKTKELQKNSNVWNNFHNIMDGFLNLLLLSKNLKVLRLLYRSIREHKTTYEQNLKRTLNILITQQINKLSLPNFKETLGQFLEEFLNRDLDRLIDDNLRWAILRKIILKIVETCELSYLAEIMIEYTPRFEKILNEPFDKLRDQPLEFYLLVKEKSRIFLIFEVMFRRLKADTIKTYVHKKLYGEQAQGNEFTKSLIQACTSSKRGQIEGFTFFVKESIQTDFPQYNSVQQVQRQFICSAYSCLTAVIMSTQIKENLYSQFLFVTNREKGDECLWQLLVDTETQYNFEVETNFNYIQLKNIEKRIEESYERDIGDIAELRAQNLINQYVTTSFMSANEKFNSAMIFETQPEKINIKSEEEKLQRLLNRKRDASELNTNYSSSFSQNDSYAAGNGNVNSENGIENSEQADEEQSAQQFELDNVNKHECMKNIKRCIDKMRELFGKQWETDKNEMPLFMQSLNNEIRRPETHLNVKIFILKIVINNPQLFQPYATHWFEPIANQICDKNNGGKGFHYFLRDLCTLLISWNFVPEENPKNKNLSTTVVNTLIKYAADKAKMIFNTNIQIIAGLLHRWRKLVAVNKEMLSMMIGMDDKKEGSNLWKMTGIQILALTVSFDIPILDNPQTVSQLAQQQFQFKLEERPDSIDKLLNNLLKIQSSKKKQIIQAASETLGKILAKQPQLVKFAINAMMENEQNERHDVLVNAIEKVSREYPQLLDDRRIFMKMISFMKVLTGSMRSAIFKTLERYINLCRAKNNRDDIDKINMALFADSDDILADISDENQQSFLIIVTQIAKLNTEQGDKMISKVLPRLKQLFVANKNDYSRGLFYDLMVFLYDQYEILRPQVKSALIRGLNDKSKLIRDKLIGFWSDPARLELDAIVRLQQIMEELYTQEEEAIWLNNSVYLLMSIANKSSDFERKIFDQPLQNCKFHPLEINQFGHNMNRSQPLTPFFSQMDQAFQASQAQVREQKIIQQQQLGIIKEEDNENGDEEGKRNQNDVEMIDTTTNTASQNSKKQFKKPLMPMKASQQFSQNVMFGSQLPNDDISDSQFYGQNVLRATQIPQFTQTQTDQSSLIASSFMQQNSSSPPITDSIFASFYEINRFNKRSQYQKPLARPQILAIKTGGQGSGSQDQDLVDEEGFLMPVARKKGKQHLAKFFAQNQYVYRPQESQGDKIRYIPQGSMSMQSSKQEEIRNMQREQFLNRQRQRMKKQVNLYRKYRVGELPDIQINYRDVLLPLAALIKNDTTIATEVFVEVFSELYKSLNDQDTRNKLGQGVRSVLNQSIIYEYGCINCMHRVAMELLKTDGFSVQAEVIQRTGQHSMSYQTALALIEETIIHGKEIQDAQYQEAVNPQSHKRKRMQGEAQPNSQGSRKGQKQFTFTNVVDGNRKYWFNMIDLYEQIGNNDALQGIWTFLADEEGIIFKKKDEEGKMSQDQEQTVNLIKEANMLRSKGSINDGLKVLEQALNDPKLTEYLEDHIKIELQNKRLDSKAELLKWDEIAVELGKDYHNQKLSDIPFAHAEKLIKAQIRHEDSWKYLSLEIEKWQHDPVSKAYLDKNFNFEVALNALTCKDFDRARFYLDKETNELLSQWKNLTKLSQVSQHILVQRIQKLYEMREFLSMLKSEGIITKDELIPQVVKSVSNWVQRIPSYAFDTISVWDDILVARNLYLDLYKFRLGSGLSDQLNQRKYLRDIDAILYVQCAKGSYKMGLYDSSDRFLKRALNIRGNESASNMKIVAPVIKLKCEQFKNETMNLDIKAKSDKLLKILQVLDKKMKYNYEDQIDVMSQQLQQRLVINPNREQGGDIRMEIKSLLLRQRLEKKMLNIILQGVQQEENVRELKQFDEDCYQYLNKSLSTLQQVIDKVKIAAHYDDQMKNTMAKTYFKFAQFSDKILRKMENENCSIVLKKSLQKIKKTEEEVARQSIRYGLQALNLEYQKASDIIPRLLDIVSKYKESVEGEFIAHSKDTPAWFFLRWINQIVAVINRQESSVIEEKVIQIAKRYPQALFYPFKVIESNTQVNVLDSEIQKTPLFTKLSKFFEKSFKNLNAWVEALDGLVYPEHRYKYWSQILGDLLSEENTKLVPKGKLKEIIQLMIYDLVKIDKAMVGDQIGSYNRKFAEKWEKQFLKCFGQDAQNVDKLNQKQLSTLMTQFNQKMSETMGNLGQGYEKVSTFSEWLDNLDINDFYNPYEYIELPGQYEGLKSEPLVEKNVKIASVRKTLLTLGSIRRPKRLTVHGSNEKDYHLLVKGGEDLRLDQRVQQLFQIMNSIFKDDAQCQNRDLYIKTFKVVPITNRLGTLEWVDDTEPLKNIVNREHMRVEAGKDLNQSRALAERRKWLKMSVPGNQKRDNIAEQHIQLLGCDEKIVIDGFNKHKDAMPWYLLRNGLENLCLTSSAFLAIKNQFTKSLATFSIASYLIGIGDRHLENFLIDTSDGEILGIDFGIAFGSGVQLTIPELLPFRLTQQIEGVIAPHPLEGVYKQTMVHVLTALRKRKSLILDTCEIFVKEPLLDWVKDAKQKQKSPGNENQENNQGGVVDSLISEYEEELQELAWYPRKKIEIVKNKLHGLNPVKILAKELKDSKHERRPYIKTILRAIEGGEGSTRHKLLKQRKKYLEVDEYIDCLIEQARDPNILGRTWIGWSPYV